MECGWSQARILVADYPHGGAGENSPLQVTQFSFLRLPGDNEPAGG